MQRFRLLPAIVLAIVCALLAYSLVNRYLLPADTSQPAAAPGETAPVAAPPQTEPASSTAQPAMVKVYQVEGMHCQGCVNTIKSRLEALPGVVSARVSLDEKMAYVSTTSDGGPTDAQVQQAIEAAGYKVQPAGHL